MAPPTPGLSVLPCPPTPLRPATSAPAPDVAATVLDQIVDHAIVVLDASGTIVSWNTGAASLLGYTATEAAGRHSSMFYVEADRRSGLPLRHLATARRDGHLTHTGWCVRSDGTRFWGDLTLTALHDDTGVLTGFAHVTRDVTEAHGLAESLRRSEERLRLLVEQVVDYAIIALDPSGTIESWNAGAQRLKGWTSVEAVGRHFSMFYTDDDRRSGLPLRLLAAARAEGRVSHTGWRVRSDGTLFWGDVTITAVHDDAGRHTGFAKVTRDLTEAHRLEEARETFLAALVHDFRSPLQAIAGYAELLPEAGPRTADFVDRIVTNTERLVGMTDRLLADARDGVRLGSPHADRVDVEGLARQTVEALGSIADVDRVAVSGTGVALWVDRDELQRIVANLVVNALKYSTDGPVEVDASAHDDRVRLSVRDHGRGIAPEDLPSIFDEFKRGRLASSSDGGTGLGLASVRQLVRRLGGTVDLDSTLGVGTTVTVDLPRRPA